ncbi:LacI family transcriptional regulator [Mycobacterium sp. 21AC1]|uniref:LacI family DNA-binding transcriptional regulator n=1 Tax=[Mycobacterium] appelbergii TaxID=2939269 RepID=UPI0029393A20|nr:LacI family DNA-binding transcriptional regulator [Mycobacterium sp. 21AC1]MDV3128870.1 LacI family transcriptional regulator [Mycobacterium sp. 21AC1]
MAHRERRVKQATVIDVAGRAGVSVATAARALRAEPSVNQDLAERVRAAAAELNYVPNIVARNLRRGSGNTVGCVVGDMLDPYFGEIAESVTVRAEEAHSMLAIVSNMQRSAKLELDQCRRLWEQRVDGLIIAGGGFDQITYAKEFEALVKQITASGVVVVTMSPRLEGVPSFTADNEAVGKLMAEHIVSFGHEHVGIVTGAPRSETTIQRLRGMENALRSAGVQVHVRHAEYFPESGRAATEQLMTDHPKVTAILSAADSMAVGAISGVHAVGKRVPQDVSVMGLGHTRLSLYSQPTLTTVDVHLAAHARAAADYIAAVVRGREPDEYLPAAPTLVVGASVDVPP